MLCGESDQARLTGRIQGNVRHTACRVRGDMFVSACCNLGAAWERKEEGWAKQRRAVAAAARRLADLPVTPPTRERRTSVGGAGAESGLPWQHLQCTGAIVYLPLRGLANGGILIAPSLMFPDRRTD